MSFDREAVGAAEIDMPVTDQAIAVHLGSPKTAKYGHDSRLKRNRCFGGREDRDGGTHAEDVSQRTTRALGPTAALATLNSHIGRVRTRFAVFESDGQARFRSM